MKKYIPLFAILLIAASHHESKCQVQKGTILVEGILGFYSNNNSATPKDFSSFQFKQQSESKYCSFQPKVGVFLSESLLVGLGLNYDYTMREYNYSSNDYHSESFDRNKLYSIALQAKKFIKIKDKLFITISGNALFGRGRNYYRSVEYTGSDDSEIKAGNGKEFNINVYVSPGLTYFLSNRWAVTSNFGQLFYQYNSRELNTAFYDGGKSNQNNFGAAFSFNTFGIGVQYFMRTKD